MKQKFVNFVDAKHRKGGELHAQGQHSHLHPEHVSSDVAPSVAKLPVRVAGKAPVQKAPPSDLDRMKEEIIKAMASLEKKPRSVPKSKLIGMGSTVDEPSRDYSDILTMLLAKK